MKRSVLINLKEKLEAKNKKPWACFETAGIEEDGRVSMTCSWNKAFIDNLKKHGYGGMTDEETVQLFFMSSQMIPEGMLGDQDTVNPTAHPQLTSEANTLVR